MKNYLLSAAFLYSISSFTNACLNTYAFELGKSGISKDNALEKIAEIQPSQLKTYQQQNDYGVLLIYAQKYAEAIKVFEKIEKEHPNLAKTAANLGTVYELNAQPEIAEKWIKIGIQRDPNIHEGSEWIHVKILQAQKQQKQNPKWIEQHDVLGLDFGDKEYPIPYKKTVIYQDQSYDLSKVLQHSKIQMNQRLQFVKRDPVSGQILFNMANIEVVEKNWGDSTASMLYELADYTGYQNKTLLKKRLDYINNTPWYILYLDAIKAYFYVLIA